MESNKPSPLGKVAAEPSEGRAKQNFTLYRRLATEGLRQRRLGAAKPHVFRAVSTENTKPQVLSAAAPPSDGFCPRATRLSSAYNLRIPRRGKADSARSSFPSDPGTPRPQLFTIHYSLFIYFPVPLRFLRAPSVPLWSQTVQHCRQRRKAPLL